jgi:hypothetical protein
LPVGVPDATVTVMVDVLDGGIVAGSKVTVTPWGTPEDVRVIGESKPPLTSGVRVEALSWPRNARSAGGLRVTPENCCKGGGDGALVLPPPQVRVPERSSAASACNNAPAIVLLRAIRLVVASAG